MTSAPVRVAALSEPVTARAVGGPACTTTIRWDAPATTPWDAPATA